MKTKIHVNQHIIKANTETGQRTPPLTVKNYKSNTKAREVFIAGPCRVVYRPDNPLDCGARVWIETDSEIVVNPLDTHETTNAGKGKNKGKGKGKNKGKGKAKAARTPAVTPRFYCCR